jgi:hypothetical protein
MQKRKGAKVDTNFRNLRELKPVNLAGITQGRLGIPMPGEGGTRIFKFHQLPRPGQN